MFGDGNTYFAYSPVVIDITGLEWPTEPASPINVVHLEVLYPAPSDSSDSSDSSSSEEEESRVVGEFRADTGGASSISFDISSALRAIWSGYDYDDELAKANAALSGTTSRTHSRPMRKYGLRVYTEYIDSTDGAWTQSEPKTFTGGQCILGGFTEMERAAITDPTKRDVSALENTNPRNGDASTKPRSTPELVGKDSITSWGDVNASATVSKFYPAPTNQNLPAVTGSSDDSNPNAQWTGHAPLVLRDSVPYTDFLFVNRRGAVETCSARMLESLGINVKSQTYSRTGAPSFVPKRSMMSVATGGRRSWPMSSGYQTEEWATWWVMEFLLAKRIWMRCQVGGVSKFMPVTVSPSKENIVIYDKTKQEMPSVEFTVTLALEG